jgi:hypothetical protein
MFGSLIRWVGHGAGSERSRRGAATAPRFALQLESLEGRAAPGSLKGEVVGYPSRSSGDEIPAILRQETPSPYQPGYEVALTDGAGAIHGHGGSQVELTGGAMGGVTADHQVNLMGGAMGGVTADHQVNLMGGSLGGVTND